MAGAPLIPSLGCVCGGVHSNGIVAWVLKKAGPPTVVVESAEGLDDVEKANEVVVLGYFEKLEVRGRVCERACVVALWTGCARAGRPWRT